MAGLVYPGVVLGRVCRWPSVKQSKGILVGGGRTQVRCVACQFDIGRLEKYTERSRSEVLFVRALVDKEEDQVIIFKGFSSSLVRPTATDPAEPVLPSSATIQSIDRIQGPYNASKVNYIQEGLSWEEFGTFLDNQGL